MFWIRDSLLSPTDPETEVFRNPTNVPWLKDVALRDLALHEKHGVCADARGDVYQWNANTGGPVLTLAGKVCSSCSQSGTFSSAERLLLGYCQC